MTGDISRYTRAQLFSRIGNRCETFARFSTVAGEQGSADTARDPLKFSDFIHSQKCLPQSGLRDATMQWDFWSLSPESLHQVTWLFGDRGIPASYRHMNGYGSHTYSLWNARGERYWVKWHFKTMQGIRNLTAEEAGHIAGENLDFHRRDLFESIAKDDFPKWR